MVGVSFALYTFAEPVSMWSNVTCRSVSGKGNEASDRTRLACPCSRMGGKRRPEERGGARGAAWRDGLKHYVIVRSKLLQEVLGHARFPIIGTFLEGN